MDLASLRAQQIELASSVIREDRLDKDPPDLIAGADVGFEQGGEVTRAAMVLLKYPSLELVGIKWPASLPPCLTFGFSFLPRISCAHGSVGDAVTKAGFSVCRWSWDLASSPSWRRQPFWFAGGCADHWRSEKRLCGKFEPLSSEPGALAPLMDKASSWHGSGAAKRAVTRCLSLPAIGSAWTARWRGYNAA